MKKRFMALNKIEYSLLTWGDPFNANGRDIILCITGNPGLCEAYTDFACEIYKQTLLPVCVMNHIGHEEIRDKNFNNLKNNEHVFDLNGQLQQKIEFIRNHLDKNSKIHLIGHSIGAWMIVELFDKYDDVPNRVQSVSLLFPTIQRMAESRNGWFMNNVVRKIYKVLIFSCIFLQWLPMLRGFLVYIYLTLMSLPLNLSNSVSTLLNPSVLEKVLFLAFEEMDTVLKLNVNGMEKLKHISNVIYGEHDKWAPLEYVEELRKFQPELQIKVVNIDHAFVLRSSKPVADMVADFINKHKCVENNSCIDS